LKKTGMREIVEKGYDEGDYEGHFRFGRVLNERETRLFAKLTEKIPQGGKILDLGSGTGIPYDHYLAERGYDVTGIDISGKHVAKASRNVPGARFVKADFTEYDLGAGFYDAIISLYSIFHVPREEHADLFRRMHLGLKPGGRILVTLGTADMGMDVGEFVGSTMAWSSYSMEENIRIVQRAGFQLIIVEEEHEEEKEHHLWILGEKVTL
jgi:SAM-dependent methyltransferase